MLRVTLSAAGLLLLGVPMLFFGALAWRAVPRETCSWSDDAFCSDYGSFYWAAAVGFALALALALWAINRKRRGHQDV